MTVGGETHTFESFERAIHAVPPRCEHCGCAMIGHGPEAGARTFCCAHCASEMGEQSVSDRAGRLNPGEFLLVGLCAARAE